MFVLVYDNEEGFPILFSLLVFNSEKEAIEYAKEKHDYWLKEYKLYPFKLLPHKP